MRKANLGLIGCGGIARHSHLPVIKELAKRNALNFVAVCDIDENRAGEYGTPHFLDNFRLLLRWKTLPDAFTAETQRSRRKT